MSSRVAVLETIAQQTLAALQDLRQEQRNARTESAAEVRGIRQEIGSQRQEMHAGFAEMRRVHDRDFRISIGVTVAVAVGLAGLIARAFHWM